MKKLMEFYDSVHMPEALERKILQSTPRATPKFRPAAAVAAVLALVLMLGFTPTVRAAVDDWITTTFPGLDLTIYQQTTPEGDQMIIGIDTEQTTFAEIQDGRLYFTGNGEYLDITDQITEEKPFFYTYSQDNYEITLIVGYAGTIENFGTYEFIKEDGTWFTGSGRNFLNTEVEGQVYPWVKAVWDVLDVPWPMPGNIIIDDD